MADYGASEYKPEFHWVVCRGDKLPENAVPGGDDIGGEVTYVGRATYADEVIPGKMVPSRGFCYVPHGKAEHKFRDCQVLVSNGAPLAWLPESKGAVPSGAIQGGKTDKGEPLYIGRARHKGMLTIGKVQPSEGCLYVANDHLEHVYIEYEVLVCKTINLCKEPRLCWMEFCSPIMYVV
ncbi:natterin-1 [Rhipicephalus sanguineus]|uniref:natterin-1 n=1 Tax=Rhipicephalus sanguineus TaxID=34632 RepID=UPI001896200B|nr:natterin-1 [Rhipicephalus sanguineus]